MVYGGILVVFAALRLPKIQALGQQVTAWS